MSSNPATISDCKCVLVIGATAGLGRALALAIHDLASKPTVIAAGRRQERLDGLATHSERIKTLKLDVNVGRDALKSVVKPRRTLTYVVFQAQTLSLPDPPARCGLVRVRRTAYFQFNKPESVDSGYQKRVSRATANTYVLFQC